MLEDIAKIYDKNGTLLKDGDRLDDGSSLKSYWREWYIDCNSKDTIFPITEFTLENYKDGYQLPDFEKESTSKLRNKSQTNTNNDTMSNSEIIEQNLGKNVIFLYYKNVYVGLLDANINKRYVRYTDCTIEIAQFVDSSIKDGSMGAYLQTVVGINYDKLVIDNRWRKDE